MGLASRLLGRLAGWPPMLSASYGVGWFWPVLLDPYKYYGLRRYHACWRFLERSQWWSTAELERYQAARLRALLARAHATVPYYRDLMDAEGLTPDDFSSIADLQRLPVLSKVAALRNAHRLVATHLVDGLRGSRFHRRRRGVGRTSGSSGTPFRFVKDLEFSYRRAAYFDHRLGMTGYRARDRHVKVWSRPFVTRGDGPVLHEPCQRRLSLSSEPAAARDLGLHLEQIHRFGPALVIAPPSFLHQLARQAHGGRHGDLRFPVAVSAYEQLYPRQRRAIEGQFGCEVFDYYTSEEGLVHAMECDRHAGLHVDVRRGVLEVLGEDGQQLPPGQSGRIVCTGFDNHLMPLIRYDLGDLGRLSGEPCGCGRGLPLLAAVEGRCSEVLHLKGRPLYPATLAVLLEDLDHIQQCQFVRQGEGLHVSVVRGPDYSEADTRRLRAALRHGIHPDLELEIAFVSRIPGTAAGKQRLVLPTGGPVAATPGHTRHDRGPAASPARSRCP